MSVSTILLALSIAATPAGPSRLDPDNIEALEALLRAMDEASAEPASDTEAEDAATGSVSPPDRPQAAGGTAAPPSRLDPDDLDALEALLRAMDEEAGIEPQPAEEAELTGSAPELQTEAQPEPEPEPAAEAAGEAAPQRPAEGNEPAGPEEERVATGPAPVTAQEPETAPQAAAARTLPTGPRPRRMGPHVGMGHYESLRGTAWGEAASLRWQVSVAPLDEEGARAADAPAEDGADIIERVFFAGNGWAGETDETGVRLYDFAARRALTLNREANSWQNTSLYAGVRRNIDIYVALSGGGQAEQIAFGPSGSFHRFWLEAAMSVASGPAGLTRTSRAAQAEDGTPASGRVTSWYRQSDEPPVASAWTGCDDASLTHAQHRSLVAAFAHRLALHPDILTALRESGEPLCALSFTVISPESPQGRVEHWRLTETGSTSVATLGFAEAEHSFGASSLISAPVRGAVANALAGAAGEPPSAPDFMVAIQALQRSGDHAGAMLTLVQETAHFGLCPSETVGSERLACAGAPALVEAGTGNSGFDAVSEAVEAAAEGSHRVAVERLLPYLDRRDFAGSAARTITARQLVDWGQEGLTAHETLDPAALLSEALTIDPHAVNIYWYLALRYLAGGAPEEAWFFLDTARALPGREPTETLQQAEGLESRLEQLAPALFPGDADG